VGQGVAQVGQAAVLGLQKKGERFVDAAGNVYEVLADATGAATNFVMDKAGTIFDVTKMAGGFLLDQALGLPGDVMKGIGETKDEIRGIASDTLETAQALRQFAKDSRPSLPPIKEMLHPKAWGQAAVKSGMKMSGAMTDLTGQLEGVIEEYDDEYCTPAAFTPSKKKPGFFKMPGFFFKVGLGNCVVGKTYSNTTHKPPIELSCTKPFLSYGHVKGKWTSKHHTAPSFKSKECKIKKEHGEGEQLVLYTFDKAEIPSLDTITKAVTDTLGSAVNGLSAASKDVASQVGEFLGGLEEKKSSLTDIVKSYEGLPQPEF
jgi:hypothetical protein